MSTFAFIGPPGTGKSTLAVSACNLGYRVHILDCDNKVAGTAAFQPYLDKGLLTYDSIDSKLVDPTQLKERLKAGTSKKGEILISAAPKKQPEGYFEIIDKLNALYDKAETFDIAVLDSFTRLTQHLKRYQLYLKRGAFEYSDWDAWLSQLEELTDAFLSIPCKHQIITYHDDIIRDEITGAVSIVAAVQGSYKTTFGRYFNEVYAMYTETKGEAVKYMMMTKPDKKRCARSSYDLPTTLEADLTSVLPKRQ